MSKATSPRERYESCAHRLACDRMARLASLMMWFSSDVDGNVTVAETYHCDTCSEWKKKETA
jgi:hypothetical protein